MEGISEKSERFGRHFEEKIEEIEALPAEQELFARILLTAMLDTFSKVAAEAPGVDEKLRERYMSFIERYTDWPEAQNVSLLHLLRALDLANMKDFADLRKWVDERFNSGFPELRKPKSLSQHPSDVERSLDSDPPIADVISRWPGEKSPQKEKSLQKLKVPRPDSSKPRNLCPATFKHSALLWQYRCKLVHEFREPGGGWDIRKEGPPHYQLMASGAVEENGSALRMVAASWPWELVYPLGFLVNLCRRGLSALVSDFSVRNVSPYQSFQFGSYWITDLNKTTV